MSTRSRATLISRLRPSVLSVCLMIAGCGGRQQWPGDRALYDVDLVIEGNAYVYATHDGYKPFLKTLIEDSAAYYDHKPEDVAGVRIVVMGQRPTCGDHLSDGCYDGHTNTISYATGYAGDAAGSCSELILVPHELLHFFLGGDPNHESPQWARLPALQQTLRESVPCPN